MSVLLRSSDFIYTRLTALTWRANPVLQPGVFTPEAGSYLLQALNENQSELPVILNCKGISLIADHSLSKICEFIEETNRTLVFMIPDMHLVTDKAFSEVEDKIRNSLRNKNERSITVTNSRFLFFGGDCDALFKSCANIPALADEAESIHVNEAIKSCYEPFSPSRKLESTPLIANGQLNARTLISDPDKFSWVAIRLTDLFQDLVEDISPRTNGILAVSLRGSPFAGAIRVLAKRYSPSLVIVDHMGPQHEMLEMHSSTGEMGGGDYIYVADFVIAGTELKVAKTFALAHDATLKGAVAIGSILPSGNSYSSDIQLRSLVTIQELLPDLKYSFGRGGDA